MNSENKSKEKYPYIILFMLILTNLVTLGFTYYYLGNTISSLNPAYTLDFLIIIGFFLFLFWTFSYLIISILSYSLFILGDD